MIASVLDPEEISAILEEGGEISKALTGYEPRRAQIEMALQIGSAYNEQAIALIEAGTGIGKSMAYLLPAVLYAARHKERTVISTHTIHLQEQLILKDLPLLLKALKLDIKVALVKGMHNYLCQRKLHESLFERPLLETSEQEELDLVASWASETEQGSRSELPFVPSPALWEKVGAEADACSHADCPHYKTCHFFKARKEAQDAHILVVNHHLLCADLSCRMESSESDNPGILPLYHRVVLDEAHHLEDVATEHFAIKVNYLDLQHQLARLYQEKKGQKQTGKLMLLKQKLIEDFLMKEDTAVHSLLSRLELELPSEKQNLQRMLKATFDNVALFLTDVMRGKTSKEEEGPAELKLRLRDQISDHPYWQKQVVPSLQGLIEALEHFVQMLSSLDGDLQNFPNEHFKEKTRGMRLDIQSIGGRLLKVAQALKDFLQDRSTETVRWIEVKANRGFNVSLVSAKLDVAPLLAEHLFEPMATVTLCSATLATNNSFDYVIGRLGINREKVRKIIHSIYASPFDYKKQALFVVPTNMPSPSDKVYTQAASEQIYAILKACKGQAFVLFTSFQMMRQCHEMLKKRLEKLRYPALLQGDLQRHALLKAFKETPHGVLFGTDSFWEGVDVVGEALRCVILVKLPFRVPSEPLTQARGEAIAEAGGDPFMDYSLPTAIVKFKQGFGRLIRNKNDKGCVVCLDPRLLNKGYGKLFLKSLPDMDCLFESGELLQEQMIRFYRSFRQ